MKLSELLHYDKIVIQCHDNPDPDTIASGYALYYYFKNKKKDVRLVYGGRLPISKPNIVMMIDELNIPIEHIQSLKVEGLVITVDCQYGAGNVTYIEAEAVAIIDHHIQEVPTIEEQEIRDELASASTLVWDMLCKEGVDVNDNINISTALYYGLFSDSSAFTELHHPLDKDMRDGVKYDIQLIRRLKNSIISLRELEIAGMALIRYSYNAANQFVMVKAQECDPNILGLISDFALQVDCVNVALVYNEAKEGIKYSVRSCVKEIMANELAAYLSEEIGNGGGHRDRAAGFISRNKYNENYSQLNTDEYFLRKLTAYYQSFEVIDEAELDRESTLFKSYQKIPLPIGYIELKHLVPKDISIMIRSEKEDIEIITEEDMFLIVDPEGTIYVIDEESFKRHYEIIDEKFESNLKYFPRIRIRIKEEGKLIDLKGYAKKCYVKGARTIKAKMLEKAVKIFTIKEPERYKVGQVGDYLVLAGNEQQDIQIIKKEVFDTNYLLV